MVTILSPHKEIENSTCCPECNSVWGLYAEYTQKIRTSNIYVVYSDGDFEYENDERLGTPQNLVFKCKDCNTEFDKRLNPL